MEPDYPAAHSMDTLFFAVDRDGHVAVFETGEAGAVPVRAFQGGLARSARERLALMLPACEALLDREGWNIPGGQGLSGRDHAVPMSSEMPMMMFLESLDPIRADIQAGRAEVLPAREGVAVLWRGLSDEDYRRLHDAGVCRGCFWYIRALIEPSEDGPASAAGHGLFEYDHLTENWVAGPYGRRRVPGRPVHVDQLPPDLRQRVKRMTFENLRFLDSPRIQPVEHGECRSWEASYLGVDGGEVRPIPGREEEHEAAFAEAEDDFEVPEIDPFAPDENDPPSEF